MVIKKTSNANSKVKPKTSKSIPAVKTSKIKSTSVKVKTVRATKVNQTKKQSLYINKTYKIIFMTVSIVFLIIGAVKILFDSDKILGLQFIITAVLFSKAFRSLSEKKVIINFKDNKTKTFFVLGFVFSIVGLSVHPGFWAIGVICFSIWLFGKN